VNVPSAPAPAVAVVNVVDPTGHALTVAPSTSARDSLSITVPEMVPVACEPLFDDGSCGASQSHTNSNELKYGSAPSAQFARTVMISPTT